VPFRRSDEVNVRSRAIFWSITSTTFNKFRWQIAISWQLPNGFGNRAINVQRKIIKITHYIFRQNNQTHLSFIWLLQANQESATAITPGRNFIGIGSPPVTGPTPFP